MAVRSIIEMIIGLEKFLFFEKDPIHFVGIMLYYLKNGKFHAH